MFSDEFLKIVISYLSQDTQRTLREYYGSIKKGIGEIYQKGQAIQCSETISFIELKDIFQRVQENNHLNEVTDYELINFLVCFELGFNQKSEHFSKDWKKSTNSNNNIIRFPNHLTPLSSLGMEEEDISFRLAEAQNARWELKLDLCFKIVRELETVIRQKVTKATIQNYWLTKITDLIVETFFTVKQSAYLSQNIINAENAIRSWNKQKDYINLTHAILRKTVIQRQFSTFAISNSQGNQKALLTLKEAEPFLQSQLLNLNNQESLNTLCSFYCDLSMSYSSFQEFNLAWHFYDLAIRQLQKLHIPHVLERRKLDIVRTKANILVSQAKERKHKRNDFQEINILEKGIEEMKDTRKTAQMIFGNDIVLQGVLAIDLIPLLASVGRLGKISFFREAQRIFLESDKRASQFNLENSRKKLYSINREFNLLG